MKKSDLTGNTFFFYSKRKPGFLPIFTEILSTWFQGTRAMVVQYTEKWDFWYITQWSQRLKCSPGASTYPDQTVLDEMIRIKRNTMQHTQGNMDLITQLDWTGMTQGRRLSARSESLESLSCSYFCFKK